MASQHRAATQGSGSRTPTAAAVAADVAAGGAEVSHAGVQGHAAAGQADHPGLHQPAPRLGAAVYGGLQRIAVCSGKRGSGQLLAQLTQLRCVATVQLNTDATAQQLPCHLPRRLTGSVPRFPPAWVNLQTGACEEHPPCKIVSTAARQLTGVSVQCAMPASPCLACNEIFGAGSGTLT